MLPARTGSQQARARRLPEWAASALAIALSLTAVNAAAQDGAAPGMATPERPQGDTPEGEPADRPAIPPLQAETTPAPREDDRRVDFEAATVAYDQNSDAVTATGDVVLRSEDRSVRADTVTWNRTTGEIVASGNVRFVDEDGNQLYTSRIELTDEFEAGAMEDLLLALREGGRLAAVSGSRLADGTVELATAAYTGCDVVTAEGCPKDPSWRITADRVIYSPSDKTVRFRGAYLELFGARLLPLPGLVVRTDGRPSSGFLVPEVQFSRNNGFEISGSYFLKMAPNKDLTLSAYAFTEAPPMASAQWRHLTDQGAYQITGYATVSRRLDQVGVSAVGEDEFRGYLFANGRFQFDPNWSTNFSVRRATDRTFLRRYDISRDDRLRSMVEVERIDGDSYLAIAGYATQTLRIGVPQGQVPIALPLIDYRKRIDAPLVGGKLELIANTLAIHRRDGQDTQRAFLGGKWDFRRVTAWGQMLTLTALLRGDVYHSDENGLTATAIYRGNPGWQTRGVAIAAADMEWPFVGALFGGTQVLTPRVQLVVSPPIRNLAVPNEDARAIDLEDSNLFALNRFPGHDRVEDRPRVTYGFDWQLNLPDWRIDTTIGQSYRLSNRESILPDGTGLSERLSDFVGRTQVRFRDFVKFTHRFRLDKDGLAVRRNELDATVGSSRTYAEVGYLRLNRDISPLIEDLRDREELRFAGRVAFANYWSVFGSGVFNLTDRFEDPTLNSDGFDPVRTRLGVAYQDDCLELGLTWRRDFVDQGDARRGNAFQLYFALNNLGFRR
ncbi:LPS assembly protein LptD [Altererythrobacter aerius]|uniref:LPS-assembly protein LptD n=1 Tax=Tsuneonella aeria TaxID=1837929 RepID=A0A6I4TDN6_9SPHN|nr:LPS assembly protein LptD [Tsuneonella aeria]MXO74488.1 LPS assembly protein LptD [Tsuneonella aeria]